MSADLSIFLGSQMEVDAPTVNGSDQDRRNKRIEEEGLLVCGQQSEIQRLLMFCR